MGRGSKMTKCGCLHVFCNHAVCMVAANAILAKMKLSKDMEDKFFIQTAHYVLAQRNAHNKGAFMIPFSNSAKGSKDELCKILLDKVEVLNTKFLCTIRILLANQWLTTGKQLSRKQLPVVPLPMEILVGHKF